jgi:ketopantoate reductase
LLEPDLLAELNATYAGSPNIVSMQQDLLRGRTTEIDYLNGAIVALGAKHGLDCPVNSALTNIIKGMEAVSHKVHSVKPDRKPGVEKRAASAVL